MNKKNRSTKKRSTYSLVLVSLIVFTNMGYSAGSWNGELGDSNLNNFLKFKDKTEDGSLVYSMDVDPNRVYSQPRYSAVVMHIKGGAPKGTFIYKGDLHAKAPWGLVQIASSDKDTNVIFDGKVIYDTDGTPITDKWGTKVASARGGIINIAFPSKI